METSNKKRIRKSAEDLGSLRTRAGVVFSWIDSTTAISNNHKMGRVYFPGFTLGENPREEFRVGDKIKMETEELAVDSYEILSTFQATKSFSGLWYGKRIEIQKRGHPYMELKKLDSAKPEILPDWLLDPSLCLTRIQKARRNDCFEGRKEKYPICEWDATFEASQVCYCKRRKLHADKCNPGLPLEYHSDSSDDSSESDDDDEQPSERVVIHHKSPLFIKRIATDLTRSQKVAVEYAVRCMERAGVAPNVMQDVLKPNRQMDTFLVDDDENFQVDQSLEDIKANFYNFPFHSSQYQVCMELLKGRHPASEGRMRNNVFFSAPCGFGKSLCFVVSAYALGGITLVVEPLRALISSQMEQLRNRGVNVQQLLSHDDAKKLGKLSGSCYLQDLANQYRVDQGNPKPPSDLTLIIFSTPEIIHSESCQNVIKCLTEQGLLSLVVIDEFDYVESCHKNFRRSYVNLVQTLKTTLSLKGIHSQYSSQIPFLFLSATGSSDLILEQLDTIFPEMTTQPVSGQFPLSAIPCQNMSVPSVLYQTSNVLPRNHIYRVEKKSSLKHAVRRMSNIIKKSHRDSACNGTSFPRCICYCLSPKDCEDAVKEFYNHRINAAVFSSNSEKDVALEGFHSGLVQVLCATSALGRGVHIDCPIPFIFHLVLPPSLTEYIQATGRGGRDGQLCHCVLFFNPRDVNKVRNVLKIGMMEKHDKERLEVSLENVCKYAMEGKECRKFLLAQSAISFVLDRGAVAPLGHGHKNSYCSNSNMCDNCCFAKGESTFKELEISAIMGDLVNDVIIGMNDAFCLGSFEKSAIKMKISSSHHERSVLNHLLASREDGKSKQSLLSDFVEYFKTRQLEIIDCTPKGHFKVFVQHTKFERTSASYDFVHITPVLIQPSFAFEMPMIRPFLVLYEINRLGLSDNEVFAPTNSCPEQLSVACTRLFEKTNQKPAPYIETLRQQEKRDTYSPVNVTFRAELQENGKLKHFEPERAVDRRIYRMYGSDRFLEISFPSKVSNKTIMAFLRVPVDVCGRSFRFFWFKRESGIHAVLFAEKGTDLKEIPVDSVQEQCIPKSCNPEFTLGKWVKRMKLNFSDTSVGCTLPPGCVSILDDFNEAGVAEIDGAGLVSEEALSAIWNGYCKKKGEISDSLHCPYSGFQGRLAGFKGVWILDSSLQGFVLQCRKSQLKYNVPMRCIDQTLKNTNDFHEQVEISSFCVQQEAKLNIRVVQILEHYATIASQIENLEQFLFQCLESTISEYKNVAQGSLETLKSKLPLKGINFLVDESYDSHVLARMYHAGVDVNDPEFHRRLLRWLTKQITNIRDKAQYNLPDSVNLRLYPDHTRLLAQHEVYISIEGKVCPANELIAMRFPSFFAGDMRRLIIIDKNNLRKRANERSVDFSFFENLQSALVTSILGNVAEASKMSGGDYDGDRAWICWNEKLLSCLPSRDHFCPQDTSSFSTPPSELESRLWSTCSEQNHIEYMINFRKHHLRLGKFCEHLDCFIDFYGFNDERTIELGKAAFLQVDLPYNEYQLKFNLKPLGVWPDWKNKECSKESNKMLGKLFRKMNVEIENLKNYDCSKALPDVIQDFINSRKSHIQNVEQEKILSLAKTLTFSYLNERLKKCTKSIEHFYQWQHFYCENVRKSVINGNAFDPNRFPLFHAAIIYSCCFEMENLDPSRKACEFAWNLCQEELLELFAGEKRLTVACKNFNKIS